VNSFSRLYSSKTDEELLALAADQDALTEDARSALAEELERRNLAIESSVSTDNETAAVAPSDSPSIFVLRAKWVGLWLLNTLIATIGVGFTEGLVTESIRPFTTLATRIRLTWTPYYPLPVIAGLVVGYFTYLCFKGSYRYWAWVAPAALVMDAVVKWRAANQSSWAAAGVHFFGYMPWPASRDQVNSTLFLYMSFCYSFGAFVQTKLRRTARG
jgi:hypothetical protein